ncbi:hypothetical protein P280DRAFT_370319, partial [Massarina eburnea CBS 473.64]
QQQQRQTSRQLPYPESALADHVGRTESPSRKRPLEDAEEWVLFSPTAAPSTTARTHTTSSQRTPRTAGLSHLSDFGSFNTAARSDQDYDNVTCMGTEEGTELDSLDDGLYAFHEPSEYAGPSSRLLHSGDTVLPTHDGMGTFQPNADLQEHMWQFETATPRRRQPRRRSSVQRRFDALAETDDMSQEQERRQRIEKWRLEQSKALLEEIERETRRRRRMSMVSAARSRADSAHQSATSEPTLAMKSVPEGQSESPDESTEDLSFWQRLTRRVIRDLMGIDEETLSVIFGESLPEEAMMTPTQTSETKPTIHATLQSLERPPASGEGWQHRLLERVARELGILVHQLSEHPGAFSTYRKTQETPAYAGLPTTHSTTSLATTAVNTPPPTIAEEPTQPSAAPSAASAQFAPSFPAQQPAATHSEASLWGIEEEPESDPLDSFSAPPVAPPVQPVNPVEETAKEKEYWERELDVKMVFNFLVQRFSTSRRPTPTTSSTRRSSPAGSGADSEYATTRRAAIIRQHHPLVNQSRAARGQTTPTSLPTSSAQAASNKRKEAPVEKQWYQTPGARSQVLSSSCASQSTKKSRKSSGSGRPGRNYWDLSGSVGSGSVI